MSKGPTMCLRTANRKLGVMDLVQFVAHVIKQANTTIANLIYISMNRGGACGVNAAGRGARSFGQGIKSPPLQHLTSSSKPGGEVSGS